MTAAGLTEKVSVAVSAALAAGLIVLLLPPPSSEAPPTPETQAVKAAAPDAPAKPPEEVPALAMIVLPPPPDLRRPDPPPADPAAAETTSRPEPPAEPPAEPLPETPSELPAEPPAREAPPPQLVLKPMKPAPRDAPPPKPQAPPTTPTLLTPLAPPAPPAERAPPEIVRRAPEAPEQVRPPEAPPQAPRQAEAESAPADAATVNLDKEDVAQGRVLLRMLEHGAGPSIEIAWPDAARQRDRLFERLRSCFGMRLAAMDERDRLYVAEGARGVPWELNLDRYSGFVRQPAGLLAAAERREFADIKSHHGRLRGAHLVRVFPRQVDALLLGGLKQIVGEGYGGNATIHARYRLEGSGVIIDRIAVDRRSLPGRIDLSPGAKARCRRSGA